MANVIGRPIEEFVEEQIKDRQKISGAGYDSGIAKTPSVINYLNNRNAWIKLASGVALKNSSGGDLYEDGGQRLKDLQKFSTDNYFTNQDIASLKGKNLAKQYVLFNTVQSLEGNSYSSRSGVRNTNSWSNSQNTLYGGMGSNTRGLQPVPGIIDVSIDTLNRGSIKKATIKLKAFNKFQFGIIEILYLRLGYIMMLEYGWDKYVEGFDANNSPIIKNMGDTIIEKEWFKDISFSQRTMLNVINRYVGKFKGNYNGFFGKVSNFKWDLNKDNTYDISITLISLGSVIESLQVQIPQPLGTGVSSVESLSKLANFLNDEFSGQEEGPFGIKKTKVDKTKKFTIEGIGDALGSDKISQFLSDAVINTPKYIAAGNTDYFYWPLFAAVANYSDVKGNDADPKVQEFRDDLAKDPSLLSEKTISATHSFYNSVPLKYRFYVRLGKLLDFIENTIIGTVNNDTEYSSRLEMDTDIEGNICTYVNNLVSLDPRIAFFSPSFQDIEGTDDILFDSKPLYINDKTIYPFSLLEPFAVTKEVGNKKAVNYGQIMNIYLNLDFINNTLKDNIDASGKVDLYSFLEGLCEGMNKTTGNSTQLSPAIRNGNIVYILEENPIPGYGLVDPSYNKQANPFNLFGYRDNGTANFVQDFKFTTKISPKLMNQISIGAAAGGYTNATNAIGYNWWNRGLINRFEEKYDVEEIDSDDRSGDEGRYENFKKNATRVTDFNNFGYKFTYLGRTMTFRRLDFCSDTVRRRWDNDVNFRSRCLKRYVLKWMKKTERVVNALANVDPRKKAIGNYNEYLASAFSFKDNIIRSRVRFSKDTLDLANDSSKGTYVKMEASGIDRGLNAFKDYLVAYDRILFQEDNINTGQTGFIPVDLSLTSDGLSGIRIYNKLEVNQRELPASYPSSLNFVITGIKDKISNNLWTTDLNTISQPPVTSGLPRTISVGTGNAGLTSEPGTLNLADLEKQLEANNIPTKSLIQKYPLTTEKTANSSNPRGRGIIYYAEETPKTQIVLHHTAGRANVRQEINRWRGSSEHIATHFIIEPNGAYDQLFDLKYWANHLGKMPLSSMNAKKSKLELQKNSISIELVSLGWFNNALVSDDDVIFTQGSKDYFMRDVLPLVRGDDTDEMISFYIRQQFGSNQNYLQNLSEPIDQNRYRRVLKGFPTYKKYQYFQGYPPAQIRALFQILEQIKEAYPNIPIIYKPEKSDASVNDSPQWDATVRQYYNMFPQLPRVAGFRGKYEDYYTVPGGKGDIKKRYSQDAVNGVPGVYTHNSYRPDKVDVIPSNALLFPFMANSFDSTTPNLSNGVFKSKNLTVVETTSNVQGSINTDPNAIISE